jgi:predicted HTH transcriptional regulator
MQKCWQRNRCALADFMQAAPQAAMREAVLTTGPGNVSGKILAAVGRQPGIAIPQLAGLIGVSARTIERHLRKLQEQGQLRRVGGARGGHWEVIGGQGE